jgi:hypothetical protein
MRFKVHLLQYLVDVPTKFGFKVYAPFIKAEIAIPMLQLSDECRKMRKWQVDYFRKNDLYVEDQEINEDGQNNLNAQALVNFPLQSLDRELLKEIINPNYVDWINKNLLNTVSSKLISGLHRLNFKGAWRLKNWIPDNHLKAYFAYLTLHPLQKLIELRSQYLRK